jgi:hypothetical protein
MNKKLMILVVLGLGLMISPKSSMAVTVDDLFISTNLPGIGGGFVGGDGDLGDPEGLDWSIGNCVPFEYTTTSDLVISTCDGDYMNPGSWKEVMRITKEGNVGIGTTRPNQALHVEGMVGTVRIGGMAGNSRIFTLRPKLIESGTIFSITNAVNTSELFTVDETVGMHGVITVRRSNNRTRIKLHSAGVSYFTGGNVGIGTTEPDSKLQVEANTDIAAGYFKNTYASGGYGIAVDMGNTLANRYGLRVYTGGGTADENCRFTVQNNGNVGIGTTSPDEKLEVEGNVKAWGYITGDITFQKDGKALWRMFEDEKGLYLESLSTGEVYRFVLEKVKK